MATTPGQISPWRYLALFAGIIVVLYSLVFLTGDGRPTPKLGIDLQGGTRVTLEARTDVAGQAPPREQLLQAQAIIQQRVDGLGVGGAEVVLDGNNLTITVPGQEGERARSLGQTAKLRIRPVIGAIDAVAPPAADPNATPSSGTPPTPAAGPAPTPAPPATGQPQGAGTQPAVKPVSFSAPLQNPTPPPPTPSAAPPAPTPPAPTSDDPRQAAEIKTAQQTRQSDDDTVLEAALQALDCSKEDPLRGFDDPSKRLVACSEKGDVKYVLDKTLIEGTDITGAQAQQNTQSVGWVVTLTFNTSGADIWGQYTTNNVNKSAAFVLDGRVVSAPTIQGPIFGTTEIQGTFNQTSAQQLAGVLRYGSLPLSFKQSEAQTVSATLGLASLQAGLIAGAVGLGLVFIYCLFYYRVLGVLTILSLGLSAAVVYGTLVLLGRWINFTLDLAGVAGFIVAIGITADSFVIFFERLKDEMRDGRTFRSAVPRGWVRARRTILSADAVMFLAAAVLYWLAVGTVKGFAFTLGMSTVLDLVVVFLVTHPLVALASNSRVFGSPALSGLGAVARIGADRKRATAAAGASKGA